MLLPVGSAVRLRLPGSLSTAVLALVGNRDRTFFAVLTADSLLIFQANPSLLLCSIRRSEQDIAEKGDNVQVFWRHDTCGICVSTAKKCLLVYRVDVDKQQCFNLREPRDVQLRRTSQELFIKENRPKITIVLAVVVRLSSLAVCVVALREELFVCLQDGWLHRIRWNGTVEDGFSIHLSRVPFSTDQLQSRADFVSTEGCHVIDAVYSPLIGGFSLVLSDGRAALLTSPNPKFHPSELLAVWAGNMNDASCTATNHKFRLITFGCRNGEIAGYHLDETTGALVMAYRVGLGVKDSPELLASAGAVAKLQWFAQGTTLAAVWSAKGDKKLPIAAIFSAFGAQIWCSLEAAVERESSLTETYTSVDWGPEGYHLWLGSDRGVSIFPFVRFIGMNNPAMEHIDHVVMMGGNQIYISPSRKLEQAASAPHGAWNMIQVPHDYLAANWPLRYCAVDSGPKTVLVAGSRGLAHYNLANNKWRLFGNESQIKSQIWSKYETNLLSAAAIPKEREMYVTGGLVLWRGFAVAACYDIDKEKDDLRFYPLSRQLDNQYCTRWFAEAQILMMNLRGDYLVTFDLDVRIYLYQLTKQTNKDVEAVDVTRCAEIRTSDLVPHPACIVSLQLTSLNHDSAAATFCPGVDTILINVAGRLIMLSPQRQSDSSGDDEPFQLNQPMLVASYVEQVWHDLGSPAVDATNNNKPHLTQALWIQSGSRGMKVWMPLFPGRRGSMLHQDSSRSFISKRIMLPFELGIHPFVICSRDCLALGVESVPYVPSTVRQSTPTTSDPSYNLHRNSEVFLHHILRQLLKRNLGLYALEIAGTCRHLPYFGHVLELLLHQVLEEEATSSEPIPDPLLPRIVAFIQEFPEFLQTVAHCARKTELALWPSLFAVTNHPRELFEVCIRDGQLETAASFLIVLQNMESSSASREHATILLEASLRDRKWMIARDITRFLKAIDPDDIDSPPRTPANPVKQPTSAAKRSLVSPKSTDEADAFVFGSYGTPGPRMIRENSSGTVTKPRMSTTTANAAESNHQGGRKDSYSGKRGKLTKTPSFDSPANGKHDDNPIHLYLNSILNSHAIDLLGDYSLRDLGSFAAHLDFHLVLWLSRERRRAARVDDFPSALMRLHTEFRWPYPLLSHTVVDQLSRRISQMNLSASYTNTTNSETGSTIGSEPVSSSNHPPLTVITRRGSFDSGLPPSNSNGDKPNSLTLPDQDTRRLLMKQQAELQSPRVSEALLVPIGEEHSGLEASDDLHRSPSSSWDADTISTSESDWEGLERLCGEAAARGPQRSEMELRFLQQIMVEAACLEWALLVSLMLRDLVGLARAINASSLAQAPEDTLDRLKEAMKKLDQWADQNCLGYKPLIIAVDRHLAAIRPSAPSSSIADDDRLTPRPSDPSPSTSKPSANNSNARPKLSKTENGGGGLTMGPFDLSPPAPGSPDGIHVDIVSPITPSQDDRQCSLM